MVLVLRKRICWTWVLLLVVAIAGKTYGAANWEFLDGFESPTGVSPECADGGVGCDPQLTDADPNTAIWNGVPLLEVGDQTLIQVFDDPNGAFSGNHYLHLNKSVADELQERYWNFPVDPDDPNSPNDGISVIIGQSFTLEFAMKVSNAVHGARHGARIWIGRRNNPPPSIPLLQGLGIGIHGGEIMFYKQDFPGNSGFAMNSLSLISGNEKFFVQANTWYHLRMVGKFSPVALPTFDLYHQDNDPNIVPPVTDGPWVRIGTDLPWNIPTYAFQFGMNSVHIKVHSGDEAIDACFDNIRLVEGELSPTCSGSATFLQADLNGDCYVNSLDIIEFALQWLNCSDPDIPGCLGPYVADFDGDNYVDYTDFSIFSLDWMDCTDPQNSVDCITWP